jgi:predicted metal-dependent peptidase
MRDFNRQEQIIYTGAMQAAGWMAPSITPYLSLITPKYYTRIATLGTDRDFRMVIGPWFFDPYMVKRTDGMTDDNYAIFLNTIRATLLLHEVMHPTLRNIADSDDHSIGNQAEDLVINQGLLQIPNAILPLCDDHKAYIGLIPSQTTTKNYLHSLPDNKTYKFYYDELLLSEEKHQDTLIDADNSNDAASADGSELNACSEVDEQTKKALDDHGVRKASAGDTVNARIRSISIASRAGSASGFDKWFVNKIMPAKVAWQTLLRRSISSTASNIIAGHMDKSYRRVSRRGNPISPQVIMPGNVGYEPSILVGIDTSGSMSWDTRMEDAASEIQGIIDTIIGANVTIVPVDTESYEQSVCTSVKDFEFRGGGGTIMNAFYENMMSMSKKPDISILLSDVELGCEDADNICTSMRKLKSTFHYIACVNKEPVPLLPQFNRISNCKAFMVE